MDNSRKHSKYSIISTYSCKGLSSALVYKKTTDIPTFLCKAINFRAIHHISSLQSSNTCISMAVTRRLCYGVNAVKTALNDLPPAGHIQIVRVTSLIAKEAPTPLGLVLLWSQ